MHQVRQSIPFHYLITLRQLKYGCVVLAVLLAGCKANVVPAPTAPDLELTLTPGVMLKLMRVPAGEFLMGSTDKDVDAGREEKPQHSVTLSDYFIGQFDVTNAQFALFVKATGYKTTAEQLGSGYAYIDGTRVDTPGADWRHPKGPSSDLGGKDNHPVVMVSWDDAVAFCAWASQVTGRKVTLPTEAQWEKAARGTATSSESTTRIYPWGNEAPNPTLLNYDLMVKDTTAVGRYSPVGDSPYGLADMAGNVWQWTSDWYDETYYVSSVARDPQGATAGLYRVLRGGSWGSFALLVRAAVRGGGAPTDRLDIYGFRVAVAATSP